MRTNTNFVIFYRPYQSQASRPATMTWSFLSSKNNRIIPFWQQWTLTSLPKQATRITSSIQWRLEIQYSTIIVIEVKHQPVLHNNNVIYCTVYSIITYSNKNTINRDCKKLWVIASYDILNHQQQWQQCPLTQSIDRYGMRDQLLILNNLASGRLGTQGIGDTIDTQGIGHALDVWYSLIMVIADSTSDTQQQSCETDGQKGW